MGRFAIGRRAARSGRWQLTPIRPAGHLGYFASTQLRFGSSQGSTLHAVELRWERRVAVWGLISPFRLAVFEQHANGGPLGLLSFLRLFSHLLDDILRFGGVQCLVSKKGSHRQSDETGGAPSSALAKAQVGSGHSCCCCQLPLLAAKRLWLRVVSRPDADIAHVGLETGRRYWRIRDFLRWRKSFLAERRRPL